MVSVGAQEEQTVRTGGGEGRSVNMQQLMITLTVILS